MALEKLRDETRGTVAERKSAADIRRGLREIDKRAAEIKRRIDDGDFEAGTVADIPFDIYD